MIAFWQFHGCNSTFSTELKSFIILKSSIMLQKKAAEKSNAEIHISSSHQKGKP